MAPNQGFIGRRPHSHDVLSSTAINPRLLDRRRLRLDTKPDVSPATAETGAPGQMVEHVK